MDDSGQDWFGEDWGGEEVPVGLATFAFDTLFDDGFFVFFTAIFPIASLFETNLHLVFPSTWIFL
jgi:hypothetical protein